LDFLSRILAALSDMVSALLLISINQAADKLRESQRRNSAEAVLEAASISPGEALGVRAIGRFRGKLDRACRFGHMHRPTFPATPTMV